jgi:bis(5'-adenosyl)-triphosphatase
VVPGHVLVVSRRVVARFADLTPEETTDLWSLAKKVGTCVESHFGATSLTYAIQDGPAAGQTVPHIHVHVLPRKPGDFENNDEVYEHIEKSGERVGEREATSGEREKAFMGKEVIREQPGERLDLDAERVVRTANEMAEEAKQLRALLDASK